ncbi:phospholipase D-like domain-containing protein [Photobacterium damselae]|uniref:phospholipase D-like domain-containing protein n=1 Tax=Photobacterium damselae TaxID=38293 RepID=UPI003D7C6D2A
MGIKVDQHIFNLVNDVLEFPFDDCTEEEQLDIQEAHVRDFIQVVNRFLSSVKRIPNDALIADVNNINTNIRHMWAAKELKTNVYALIDHLYELVGNPSSGFYRSEELISEQYFQGHKNKILEQINAAQFSIWVAVAWFTDKDLANVLIRKVKQGLNVRIIMNKDKINNTVGCYLDPYIELIGVDPRSNLMHHKFCVIDFKIVLHGSYNWTNRAAISNRETLSVSYSTKLADKYSQEFIRLVKRNKFV